MERFLANYAISMIYCGLEVFLTNKMRKIILPILAILFLCLLVSACSAPSAQTRVREWEKSVQDYEAGTISASSMEQKIRKNLEEGAQKSFLQEQFGFAGDLQADLLYRTVSMQASLNLSDKARKEWVEKTSKYRNSYFGEKEIISQKISSPREVGDQQVLVLRVERKHPRYGAIHVQGSVLYKKYYLKEMKSHWKIMDYDVLPEILWQDERSDHTQEMLRDFFSDIGGEPEFLEMP